MIAIVEIDPTTKEVKSLKFSANIAEVNSTKHVHIINIREPYLDPSEDFKASLKLLMNNPQSLTISSTTGTRSDLGGGSYNDGLLDHRDHNGDPFARELSNEEKNSVAVRPAAERAGQTSFFGNL